jgi:class 3 adenylate cyclase
LVDRFTREGLPADIKVEDLGEVAFKGKQKAVNIFAVSQDQS